VVDKNGNKELLKQNTNDSTIHYENKVIVRRLGEIIMPVEVLIHFEDGREVLKKWNGKERSFEFNFKSGYKIDWVKIDPKNKILIDVNLANNKQVIKQNTQPMKKFTIKFLFWIQNIIQSFLWFV